MLDSLVGPRNHLTRRRFLTDILFISGSLVAAAWLTGEVQGGPAKPKASTTPSCTQTPTSTMRGDFISPASRSTPGKTPSPPADGNFTIPVKRQPAKKAPPAAPKKGPGNE